MKHMKRSARILMVAFIAIVSSLVLAAPAMASSPSTTITQKSLTTTFSHHLVSATSLAKGKVTVLAREMANGLPKAQQVHCRMIGQGTDVPKYLNSGISSGVRWWFWDTRLTRVCSVGGHWHKVSCGNLIRFRPPPSHLLTGKVIMVKSFAHVLINVRAWVHVKATASCGFAEAMASASSKVRLRILAKARGSAVIKLWAQAQASAKAKATAEITCSSPPGEQPPEVNNPTPQVQEVFTGKETISICVTSTSKNGNSITVGFGAKFGTFTPGNQPFVSDGTNNVCSIYTSPESPDAAGMTEILTFTVHDNDTGLNGKSIFMSFPIKAPPPPPGKSK